MCLSGFIFLLTQSYYLVSVGKKNCWNETAIIQDHANTFWHCIPRHLVPTEKALIWQQSPTWSERLQNAFLTRAHVFGMKQPSMLVPCTLLSLVINVSEAERQTDSVTSDAGCVWHLSSLKCHMMDSVDSWKLAVFCLWCCGLRLAAQCCLAGDKTICIVVIVSVVFAFCPSLWHCCETVLTSV